MGSPPKACGFCWIPETKWPQDECVVSRRSSLWQKMNLAVGKEGLPDWAQAPNLASLALSGTSVAQLTDSSPSVQEAGTLPTYRIQGWAVWRRSGVGGGG